MVETQNSNGNIVRDGYDYFLVVGSAKVCYTAASFYDA